MNKRDFLKRAGVASLALLPAVRAGRAEAADPATSTILVAYHAVTGNTEKMAQAVAEGARSVAGASVALKRVGDVTGPDLLAADAVIVGSPVYFGNVSAEVKAFLDNWMLKFNVFQDRKMRTIGAAFATGASVSNGKEVTMLAILARARKTRRGGGRDREARFRAEMIPRGAR